MELSIKNKIIIMLLILLTVGVLSLFFVSKKGDEFKYEVGKPWNYPKLIAPFEIPIFYDSISTERIKDSIKTNFMPLYIENNAVKEKCLANIESSIKEIAGLGVSNKLKIIANARNVFEDGIVDIDTYNKISHGEIKKIRLIRNNGNVADPIEVTRLRSKLDAFSTIVDTIQITREVRDMLNTNIKPTLDYDAEKSIAQLNDQYRNALAPYGIKPKGAKIIDNGDIVTPETYTLIKTYEEKMSTDPTLDTSVKRYSHYGNVVVFLMILLVYYLYIRTREVEVFARMRSMLFLFSFIFVFVLIVYLITQLRPGFLYVVPFALVPIVVTIFFSTSLGFLTHMVVVLLCSFVSTESIDFVILQFLAGIIAIVSIKGLMQRSQLVVCALFIFLSYSIIYLAQNVVRTGALETLDWHLILYFAVNCIVLSFAYFVIFIIEKLFGFTSQVTLVELSDINNSVLRELSENCPGTFQHSLQVATLAGEAARQIGANVQLVRAGALYHDIGKIDNPAFFTENQSGINPHDVLSPEQSAAIVISHVADGVRRAEKAKLPQVIRDLIAQHHGTSKTRYFYNKALQQSATGSVDDNLFTYSGPNPKTKEAAILMMADASEAATKSLSNPNEESITGLVDKIIESQVADGMFREAPISYKEISEVKKCLIKRLLTFYHTRVSYPDEMKSSLMGAAKSRGEVEL